MPFKTRIMYSTQQPAEPLVMRLRFVRTLHTIIWAFFAGCVVVIPVLAWAGMFSHASIFIGIVLIEVLILAVNRWHCPLTTVAARYTGDRRDNFDIYLPEWLARHNKLIFGTIYMAGIFLTLVGWIGWLS
jgi:polyferredoxin